MNVQANTTQIQIYMAGDIAQAKQVCREYCFEVGLCVTIEPVDYIYTGGEEAGFRVGLINYPRFPATDDALLEKARGLADRLMRRLCQYPYSIVGAATTEWVSRRPSSEIPT